MRRPYLVLVGVCAFWGTIPLVVRSVDLPAVDLVAARVWIAAAALGVAVWLRRGRHDARGLFTHRPALSVTVGIVLAAHWVAFFAAYRRAPIGTVILVVYLAPVAVAAIAPRALDERTGRTTLVALALAAGGFVLVAGPARQGTTAAGLVYASAAAGSFVVLILLSKPLSEAYGGLRLAFIEFAVAGVCLVPFAATSPWGRPQPSWGWLLVLGLVHTAAAVSAYLWALSKVPATHVGILGYLEPTSAVLLAWLVLGERPSAATAVGGALVLAAGALVITSREAVVHSSAEVPLRVPR